MNGGNGSFLELPANLQATDPRFLAVLNDRLRRLSQAKTTGTMAAAAPSPPRGGGEQSVLITPQSFGAKADTIEQTDGAMTAGSATLTSALGIFSNSDIGKAIWVGGAEVTATITAVASATSITVSAAATATVSAATYRYGTNDTAAFLSCMAAETSIYVPDGYYFITDTLKIQRSGIRFYGAGIGRTTIFRPTGYILTNYTTLDTAPAINYVNTYFDFSIEDMRLQGGYQIPDSYATNPTTSGRSKTLATTGLNVGIRLKLGARVILKKIAFEELHRGLEMRGGEINTLYACTFLGCQVGQYLTTGFEWGNGAFKITTHTSEKCEYRESWFGIWSDALVDASIIREDVFQLVNTGLYLSNVNGTKLLSCYFEADYEGLVTDGGYNGAVVCDHFCYEGPGGGGYAVTILISSGPYGSIDIINMPTPILGGGGAWAATGRISIDRAQTPLLQPSISVSNVHNTGLWPDPTFTRKFIPATNPGALPSGLTAMAFTVDTEGNNVLRLTGAGGVLNYAGVKLGVYPTLFDGPLRIQYEYRYFGTTPYFQPLGMVLYDGTQNLPIAPVCSPTYVPGGVTANALWQKIDAYSVPWAGLPGAAMQGNFDGYIEIRKLYISSGFGLPGNYNPEPAKEFMVSAVPTWGTWREGDFCRNALPAAGDPLGWLCIAGGTPGTWQAVGAAPNATAPIPVQGTGADIYGGAGAPSFAAAAGSVYVNIGGGSNNTLWIKESGSGTTGWVPYGAPTTSTSPVTSVFGRTGAVVAAIGDYAFAGINGTCLITQGGTGTTTVAGARANLGAAGANALGFGATVPLAKLTSGGANGSLTFNNDGQLIGRVNPT